MAVIPAHESQILDIAVSPDGTTIATCGMDGAVYEWTTDEWDLHREYPGHPESTNAVTYTHEGDKLATGSTDTTIKLWDTDSGQLQTTLEGHDDMVSDIVATSRGTLLTASYDGTVRRWKLRQATEQKPPYSGHDNTVTSVESISVGSDELAISGGIGTSAMVWDSESCEQLAELAGHSRAITNICPLPNAESVLTSAYSGDLLRWNTATWENEERETFGDAQSDFSLTAFPSSDLFAVGAGTSVQVVSVPGFERDHEFSISSSEIGSIAVTPDGGTLIVGCLNGTLRLLDTSKGGPR